jgi:hypothetical protein
MLPGKETLVMTEDEQLANLRENPNWQPKLDPLAKEAAEKGRLVDAVVKANTRMGPDFVSSSVSSMTVAPARMPESDFSNLPNVLGTFYAYLEDELLVVLGRPLPVKFN